MYSNKLIAEKSPYLLQHAHNPVAWLPWGEEAFQEARRRNQPIFLSVGYSTCHWCHVMERESFESEEVADFLNRHFVPVKVDREERPDVDRLYMTFVQATTGSGGWPMSVWLTPDLKPFFGGTYFPPVDSYGRPSFMTVLHRLAEAWERDRDRIIESSDKVLEQLREYVESVGERPGRLDDGIFDSCFFAFRRSFDLKRGGFGDAPKFPRPVAHNFLLRYYVRTSNREALDMVLLTLRQMAAGGIHDQLGGGFHRYSVDERWFVPHFEKMLYDQAQLAISYLEAYQITGEELYATAARGILEYVLRDMTHPEGGFYSAEDADSAADAAHPEEKREGAFYLWRQGEIEQLLGQPRAEWFCFRYGVEAKGNVRNDPVGEFAGQNILFQAHSIAETAQRFGVTPEQMNTALEAAREKLFAARSGRIRPHLDDKILTAWNGLMISAFATGFQVLGDARYLQAARRTAKFVLERMYDPSSGLLLRRHRDGEAAIAGFLDDYAFFIQALLDLYESTFDLRYLETAERLAEQELRRFEDPHAGGFFSSAAGDESLVLRIKDDYDGAEPSGNSMAVLGLLRLAEMTGREEFRRSAQRALEAFSSRLLAAPATMPQMVVALEFARSTRRQIILAGALDDPATQAFRRELGRRFLPHRIVLMADARLAERHPAIAAMRPVNGKPAAYVCENFTCRLPATDLDQLRELLQ